MTCVWCKCCGTLVLGDTLGTMLYGLCTFAGFHMPVVERTVVFSRIICPHLDFRWLLSQGGNIYVLLATSFCGRTDLVTRMFQFPIIATIIIKANPRHTSDPLNQRNGGRLSAAFFLIDFIFLYLSRRRVAVRVFGILELAMRLLSSIPMGQVRPVDSQCCNLKATSCLHRPVNCTIVVIVMYRY